MEPDFPDLPTPTLRLANPYLAFARTIELFYTAARLPAAGIHPTAVIAPHRDHRRRVPASALTCVIGEHVVLGDDAVPPPPHASSTPMSGSATRFHGPRPRHRPRALHPGQRRHPPERCHHRRRRLRLREDSESGTAGTRSSSPGPPCSKITLKSRPTPASTAPRIGETRIQSRREDRQPRPGRPRLDRRRRHAALRPGRPRRLHHRRPRTSSSPARSASLAIAPSATARSPPRNPASPPTSPPARRSAAIPPSKTESGCARWRSSTASRTSSAGCEKAESWRPPPPPVFAQNLQTIELRSGPAAAE